MNAELIVMIIEYDISRQKKPETTRNKVEANANGLQENNEEIYDHGTPGFQYIVTSEWRRRELEKTKVAVELDRRRSDGVFASPFTCGGFISGTVSLVHMSNLRHQRVIRVGICEHGAYREQHCAAF
jgi:hypothetical protein